MEALQPIGKCRIDLSGRRPALGEVLSPAPHQDTPGFQLLSDPDSPVKTCIGVNEAGDSRSSESMSQSRNSQKEWDQHDLLVGKNLAIHRKGGAPGRN
jgi:hypothetical protein